MIDRLIKDETSWQGIFVVDYRREVFECNLQKHIILTVILLFRGVKSSRSSKALCGLLLGTTRGGALDGFRDASGNIIHWTCIDSISKCLYVLSILISLCCSYNIYSSGICSAILYYLNAYSKVISRQWPGRNMTRWPVHSCYMIYLFFLLSSFRVCKRFAPWVTAARTQPLYTQTTL